MKKIVLIGVGQLGSRHLQSLALLENNLKIQVVDPSDKSLKVSKQRFEEIESNNSIKVEYLNTLYELDEEIDLCIVATTANIRADVIKKIISNKKVKVFILEKVLFQKISDFYEIKELLDENNIKCWVNHPFRSYPIYKELKKYFKHDLPVSYHLGGGQWGLGCNGLHYIDHLAYLTNDYDLTIDISSLDKNIVDSKRKGFIEFTGKLIGSLGKHNFILHSEKYDAPITITIQNENIKVILDEVSGWLKVSKKENDWKWEDINEKIMYFQSELTYKVVQDIFSKNTCDLPTYEEAIKLHKPFLNALIEHLNITQNKNNELCPIT